MRSRLGQISPAGISAKAAAFSSELQQRMGEVGVDVLYNADQTPVFFENISTKTIEAKGPQTVWVRTGGKKKERVKCMLLGDSFGNEYQPFLIFKTTTPMKKETAAENNAKRHVFGKRLWIKPCDLQSTFGVPIYANATVWWNAEMSVRYLEYHFGERQNGCKFALKSSAWCLCELRVRWAKMLHQQLGSHRDGGDSFKLVPPTRDDMVEWLAEAWQEFSIVAIINGFSPSLKEGELPESMRTSYNNLASRLQDINLLDGDVGIVSVSSDVVDSILESNR
uniref:Uncharacterized protein AlNc14C42G3551 n=1 Tax=Albugo laibachii Nc14 TaxID=890382 RepID=F0WA05_9STRA|nr:conserved hypothetical protein [Albugo laibachii Nc14]|eukprot:CCA17973.1 conserved hypothetical protein [Albugo laibachii Nc14]